MKTKTLAKIVIASALCAPACSLTETGVVICKQDAMDEKALFVNVIQKDKSQQKPLHDQTNEVFDADRKLFFLNENYTEPFDYACAGDTITYYNASRQTFLRMGSLKKMRVHEINGVPESDIIKIVRANKYQRQK